MRLRFFTTADAPTRSGELVCRQSWWQPGVAALVLMLVSGATTWFVIQAGDYLILILGLFFAGLQALAGLIFLSFMRATLQPASWLLRYDGHRVLLRFRSYANWRLATEDEVVCELLPEHISTVWKYTETRITPTNRNGRKRERRTYLVFDVRTDLAELMEQLRIERSRRVQAKRGSSIVHHYPVRVVPDGTLRVDLTGVRPGADNLLGRLAESFNVAEPRQALVDMTIPASNVREREAQIIDLVEEGRDIDAICSVRKLYGYSLAEARTFVRNLRE